MWLKNIATFSRSSNNIRSSKKPVACNFRLCGRRIPENWKPGSLLPVSPGSVQQGWRRWSRAGEREETCFPFTLKPMILKAPRNRLIGPSGCGWFYTRSFLFLECPFHAPPVCPSCFHLCFTEFLIAFLWEGEESFPAHRPCHHRLFHEVSEWKSSRAGICCLIYRWEHKSRHRQCLALNTGCSLEDLS